MLQLYAERARITASDRFRIMDLGCGWGSATLWFAERFPNSEIVGLSNSRTQREYILAEANKRGLTNVDVLTGDIDTFELPQDLVRYAVDVHIAILSDWLHACFLAAAKTHHALLKRKNDHLLALSIASLQSR